MKVKILKEGVTLEKAVLDVGVTLDMSKEEADRLIKYGLVEAVDEPAEEPAEEQPGPKKATRGKKSE